MYVYMYVYVCVCMYVCAYVHTYVCTYACMRTYIVINIYNRLIISDGSGEALLYCYENLVPTALACNMAEWHSVEDKTKTFGELTYQKPKKSAGTAVQVQ